MKLTFELLPPTMPNYVKVNKPLVGSSNNNDYTSIDIADFTEAQATQYAELMRKAFMKHYKERKARFRTIPDKV